MYQKILIPVDGSEFSERSLPYAKAIAAGCDVTKLVLLRVVEPIQQVGSYLSDSWLRELEERNWVTINDYLAKMASKLQSEGVTVQTAVSKGNPADEILNYAIDNQVDLIIMSTHGSSGVARWFIGSVANKVVRHSKIPVLVIPLRCVITTSDSIEEIAMLSAVT